MKAHFGGQDLASLVVTTRAFVHRIRPDLQLALNELLRPGDNVRHFSGLTAENQFFGMDFSRVISPTRCDAMISPAEYEQVDIGEEQPVACLKIGFWLFTENGQPFALLMAPTSPHAGDEIQGMKFFAACRPGSQNLSENFLRRLEEVMARSKSYRGKVLSLERGNFYNGKGTGVTVHRLTRVDRDDLILPADTVQLLERNVLGFCKRRAELAKRGQSAKKGLLFYGPPGTGKTFTIRYLAGVLPEHTTLLITAEQVGLLPEYMTLARLLQPSIVVIEDADLIARERNSMESACEEVMLNKLLNEMDGLREDSQVLFILTTNRPEQLEGALAGRPGRIDQAIEFPAPNAENRAKLVRVYGRGMPLSDDVVAAVVSRTEGVSASFIKELMRRATQFCLEREDPGADISVQDSTTH